MRLVEQSIEWRRKMKRILLAAIAVTTLASASALAADLPQRPVYKAAPVMIAPAPTWTGCYVGGNIGAGWGRAQVTDNGTGAGVSGTNTGFVGGGQIGCDYQFAGGFVIGARDMFDGSSLNSGSTFATGNFVNGTANSKTTWFNTLTARIGYAVVPNTLIYFQAGGAWTRTTQSIYNAAGVQLGQFANNNGGYDVGGGAEYMFAPNWSTFLEYNYMNFGTNSGTTTTGVPVSLKHDTQTFLVGVNYRFH
jgi:outer membrane immunogenic protein